MGPSLLPVVVAADNFPSDPLEDPYPRFNPVTKEHLIPFHITFADYQAGLPPVGLLRPDVLHELESDEREPATCPWQFHYAARPAGEDDDELELSVRAVFFADWVVEGGKEGMGKVMQETAERWKSEGKFRGVLDGWRNEKYAVYASPRSTAFARVKEEDRKPFWNMAFALERSACPIFGVAMYGVHLMGEGKDMKLWVPRRSATKPTYPGMLDNSVAGGIPAGYTPLECIIKEADEEASLPEAFVRPRIHSVGIATKLYVSKDGHIQPELDYLYDLKLPEQSSADYIALKPHDDEVESFKLMGLDEVIQRLHAGEFKHNCGLIMVEFLMRHGLVTPETEPNYIEISNRIHRRLGWSIPS